jgi:hypothetical protein
VAKLKPPPTPEQLQFASDLQLMAHKAGSLGLYRTMHRIKDAAREVGWELSGEPTPKSERKRMYCETPGVRG